MALCLTRLIGGTIDKYQQARMHSIWVLLGQDTLRSAVLVGTRIRSGVSSFYSQLVEVAWHRFREAGIQVQRTKTGILKPQ